MMKRRIIMLFCALILVIGQILLAQQPQASSAGTTKKGPEVPGEKVYFYNGQSRVDLVLALDEVRLENGVTQPPSDAVLRAASARVQSSAQVAGSPRMLDVKLANTGARAELNKEARNLKAASGALRAQAIMYVPSQVKREALDKQALTERLAVKIRPGQDINDLCTRYNLKVIEKVTYSPDTYLLEAQDSDLMAALTAANAIYEKEGAEFATPMIARQRSLRAAPNDPLYPQQWHLKNTGQTSVIGAVAGNDCNVEPAWAIATGAGVNIGVSDDGLQVAHPDLAPNARTDIDIDINYKDLDPSPDSPYTNHGTCVAGVAGAKGNNGIGVSGAAPDVGLVGIRVMAAAETDADEAQAMLHQMAAPNDADRVHINTNSWGPVDTGTDLATFGPLMGAALLNATTNGRGGKGTVFTWAGGNGLQNTDNVNYDGYASSRYTIAVAATGADGRQSYYSEPGASLVINTCSSYAGGGITTTDRTGTDGYAMGDYNSSFGGTSSAAPLAAGCIALMLQANPSLTWRDVQHVLINTATKNIITDSDWKVNGSGKLFNHKYGYGRLNAYAAVKQSQNMTSLFPTGHVPAEATPLAASEAIVTAIPDNSATGITRSLSISGASTFKTETVEVTVNITHPYRGDLAISLISPSGMVSRLAEVHNDSNANYNNWMFTSFAHWDENPNGIWRLVVADLSPSDIGSLVSWSMKVHGYVDPNAVTLHDDLFSTANAQPGGAADGFTIMGATSGDATLNAFDYDQTQGAYRIRVFSDASRYRTAGWLNNRLEWLPYSSIGAQNYVRGKFYIYAQGAPSFGQLNEIPNFQMRLSSRFGVISNLMVGNHNSADSAWDSVVRDLRPSTDPTKPSVYRLDFDPIDVPYLATTTGEGVGAAFEVFSIEPQENGYICLSELNMATYPAALAADTRAVASKVFAPTGTDAGNLKVYGPLTDLKVFNYAPPPAGSPAGTNYVMETDGTLGTYTEDGSGIYLDTRSVPVDRIGVVERYFFPGAIDGSVDNVDRIRVEEGKLYKVRWHVTSTQPTSQQAGLWLEQRSARFSYISGLELGGAYVASSASNQAIVRQSLPGVGCLNSDKLVANENGGWYTGLMNSPLSVDIRPEFSAGTPITTRMPGLALQPGPGVDATSARDVRLHAVLYDTISAAPGKNAEAGYFKIDRIEVRVLPQIPD